MDNYFILTLARSVHVLALIHWIGGVAVATTIILPQARRCADATAALALFEIFERRFATQVRYSILLVGLSGVAMLTINDGWSRFSYASFWWLDLMVAVWALFAVMVFVAEPILVRRRFHAYALQNKDKAFTLATRFHAIALTVSMFAVAAGIFGAHGALP